MWPLLLGIVLFQPAAEPPSEPIKGSPPLIVKATVSKDELVSVKTYTAYTTVTSTRQRVIGGKVVTETVATSVPVTRSSRQSWDLKKAKITTVGGKKIDLETLRKRLAVETPVVVSADGKPIDKGYLALMRPGVIVIVAPLQVAPVPQPQPPK